MSAPWRPKLMASDYCPNQSLSASNGVKGRWPMTQRILIRILACIALTIVLLPAARGQPAPAADKSVAPGSDFVSRAEYDQLKRDQDALRKKLAELQNQRPQPASAPQPADPPAQART